MATAADNPFFKTWTTPFGVPPFAEIRPEHFRPAFDKAFADHRLEIDAIANDPAQPDFANTIDALELSGELFDRVGGVFWNLASADTNPELQAIEREIAPLAAKHYAAIGMNEGLFRRIDALWNRVDALGLDPERRRVLELTRKRFVRAGAMLAPDAKKRLAAIIERLAELGTAFSQNVLADEANTVIPLETAEDRAGLPDWLLAAAARTAEERGLKGWAITTSRSLVEPFLQFSTSRPMREKAYAAWIGRGESGGATDNRSVVAEMLALRAERARLLGFRTFAEYKLEPAMAKTPDAVMGLLERVWAPARDRAAEERAALQDMIRSEGGNFELGAHDWRHYSAKVRAARHALDEGEIKPYLQLDRIIEAAFDTATRLFGVRFEERKDVPVYRSDVRAWEVKDRDGRHLALFYGDYFARPSKRSGAWMNSFRSQYKLGGEDVRPIVVNVLNFARAPEGEPTLLSFDDARTVFHEFGHALHGMLSDVTYPSISGTSVARDFVEFPSQVYEHWLMTPEVLSRFAVHAGTGEPMPQSLIEKVQAARNFNMGFATVEYASSALVDMAFHALETAEGVDPLAFERDVLARIGMPAEIAMRHRTPHFTHVFSGDGYSAGYYSYLWSEVLDADGFSAFEETGDVFHPELAARLREHVYAAGSRRDPAEAYRAFRGRDPDVDALLRKRGFLPA